MSKYSVVQPDDVKDFYAGTDVPGEFRSLTTSLNLQQLAATLIRIPPHSDFEQGTGHFHSEREELYIITSGSLTMRFDNNIEKVNAGSIVRVAPGTKRSHRNEGDETVNIWAISVKSNTDDSVKIDNFWDASPEAKQTSQ